MTQIVDEVGRHILESWAKVNPGLDEASYQSDKGACEQLDKLIVEGLRVIAHQKVKSPARSLHRWFMRRFREDGENSDLLIVYLRVLDDSCSLDVYKRLKRMIEGGEPDDRPVWTETEDGHRVQTPYNKKHGIETIGDELRHHRRKLMKRGLIGRKK